MSRGFNIDGPCDPEIHYMLPAERRLPEVRGLIAHHEYFVVHGPRQVGKTTSLTALARQLTKEGRYTALLVSSEIATTLSSPEVGAVEEAILSSWRKAAEVQLSPDLQPPHWPEAAPGMRIGAALGQWAIVSPRPLVVFIDDSDSLPDHALLSMLGQLRGGHPYRPDAFPISLALVGLRALRDYKVRAGENAIPFNIVAESLRLRDFTRDEVAELYAQAHG